MATLYYRIRCQNCGEKAAATLVGAEQNDGVYCVNCGRRKLEDYKKAKVEFHGTAANPKLVLKKETKP